MRTDLLSASPRSLSPSLVSSNYALPSAVLFAPRATLPFSGCPRNEDGMGATTLECRKKKKTEEKKVYRNAQYVNPSSMRQTSYTGQLAETGKTEECRRERTRHLDNKGAGNNNRREKKTIPKSRADIRFSLNSSRSHDCTNECLVTHWWQHDKRRHSREERKAKA